MFQVGVRSNSCEESTHVGRDIRTRPEFTVKYEYGVRYRITDGPKFNVTKNQYLASAKFVINGVSPSNVIERVSQECSPDLNTVGLVNYLFS